MKEIEEKVLFTNYRLCLRDAVGDFTKQLINNLFDVNHLSESGERTRRSFLNILERLSIENGEDLWDNFENYFVTIRQKLDLDAAAAEKKRSCRKKFRGSLFSVSRFLCNCCASFKSSIIKTKSPYFTKNDE